MLKPQKELMLLIILAINKLKPMLEAIGLKLMPMLEFVIPKLKVIVKQLFMAVANNLKLMLMLGFIKLELEAVVAQRSIEWILVLSLALFSVREFILSKEE